MARGVPGVGLIGGVAARVPPRPAPIDPNGQYTLTAAARALRTREEKVRVLVTSGEIPAGWTGRAWVILGSALVAYREADNARQQAGRKRKAVSR